MVLAKQEINCLLETLQKQQHQFTELADHIQLDAGIPVTFTKVHAHSFSPMSPHLIQGQAFMRMFFMGTGACRTTGSTSVRRWRSGW